MQRCVCAVVDAEKCEYVAVVSGHLVLLNMHVVRLVDDFHCVKHSDVPFVFALQLESDHFDRGPEWFELFGLVKSHLDQVQQVRGGLVHADPKPVEFVAVKHQNLPKADRLRPYECNVVLDVV